SRGLCQDLFANTIAANGKNSGLLFEVKPKKVTASVRLSHLWAVKRMKNKLCKRLQFTKRRKKGKRQRRAGIFLLNIWPAGSFSEGWGLKRLQKC
ncbi:MAG: hypothetical protein WBA76_00510, partial [Phormidesmis sp.]